MSCSARSSSLRLAAISAALLFAAGCAHTQEPGPVIKKFEIEGNEHVKDKEIQKVILTSQSSWIPFSKKKHFDPNVWNTDLKRIERYYHSRGYYQAQITDQSVEPSGEDAVRIHVKIHEGDPTKIARVAIAGLDGLPEKHRNEVMKQVTLKEGDVFSEDEWEALKGRITAKLQEFGYAEAKAEGEAKVDLATQQAFVDVNVTPGVRYHPGEIHVNVKPGARVEEWRVREQVKEAIEDEKWFTPEVRKEAQQRVFDMGVFGAAQVTPLPGDPATETIPVQVDVQESPFHDVGVGFGIGIEQQRNEVHLIGEYTNRDFLGGLRKLGLTATAGYAFIPNAFTVARGSGNAVTRSGPIAKLEAQLDQPRFFSPNFKIHSELEAERAIEPAYSYYGGRLKLGVPWKPYSWLEIQPSYNFEIYRLDEGETTLTGGSPQLLFGCTGTCILSYLEERIAVDRRDNPQEPHDGYYLALSFQQGGGPLGGTFDYLRISPEARGYTSFTVDKRVVLAGRLKLGTLIPIGGNDDSSPIVARYFSGGDEMRGFSTQRLSPMRLEKKSNPSPNDPYNAEVVPIGGNGLTEASIETRYSLTQALILAGFLDTGFVTREQLQWTDPGYFTGNLLYAVGAGVRYRTPVGPVRLDFAYRLPFGPPLQVVSPDSSFTYAPSTGCFGIGKTSTSRGGSPEGACQIHLSIGEAF